MRLSTEHALQYLKDNEFPLSRASYFRHKKKLEEKKLKRLYEIAKIGFQDQHLERIDIYEMGFKMMWQNVSLEKDPYKRNSMIKDILLLQPYLSAYYEATKLVIAKQPDYQGFLDKQQEEQQQQQPIKQEDKITAAEFKQQIHDDDNEQENSRNYDDDDYEEEEFNNNNNSNAKF
jgi:PIN domain nuclease of toxin-antitoxin system